MLAMYYPIELIVQHEFISVNFSLILFILNSEASQSEDRTTAILLSKNHLLDEMTLNNNHKFEAWKKAIYTLQHRLFV